MSALPIYVSVIDKQGLFRYPILFHGKNKASLTHTKPQGKVDTAGEMNKIWLSLPPITTTTKLGDVDDRCFLFLFGGNETEGCQFQGSVELQVNQLMDKNSDRIYEEVIEDWRYQDGKRGYLMWSLYPFDDDHRQVRTRGPLSSSLFVNSPVKISKGSITESMSKDEWEYVKMNMQIYHKPLLHYMGDVFTFELTGHFSGKRPGISYLLNPFATDPWLYNLAFNSDSNSNSGLPRKLSNPEDQSRVWLWVQIIQQFHQNAIQRYGSSSKKEILLGSMITMFVNACSYQSDLIIDKDTKKSIPSDDPGEMSLLFQGDCEDMARYMMMIKLWMRILSRVIPEDELRRLNLFEIVQFSNLYVFAVCIGGTTLSSATLTSTPNKNSARAKYRELTYNDIVSHEFGVLLPLSLFNPTLRNNHLDMIHCEGTGYLDFIRSNRNGRHHQDTDSNDADDDHHSELELHFSLHQVFDTRGKVNLSRQVPLSKKGELSVFYQFITSIHIPEFLLLSSPAENDNLPPLEYILSYSPHSKLQPLKNPPFLSCIHWKDFTIEQMQVAGLSSITPSIFESRDQHIVVCTPVETESSKKLSFWKNMIDDRLQYNESTNPVPVIDPNPVEDTRDINLRSVSNSPRYYATLNTTQEGEYSISYLAGKIQKAVRSWNETHRDSNYRVVIQPMCRNTWEDKDMFVMALFSQQQ